MDNKLDPIHAVASLSLSLLEIQKDVSQMRRQVDSLIGQVYQLDKAASQKFKEVDDAVKNCYNSIRKVEKAYATNIKGQENISVDDQAVREEES